MGRRCTICTHPERTAIERALLARLPNRRIAAQRGVSEASLRRHFGKHLPEHMARAWKAEQNASAADLLADLRELDAQTREILEEARQNGHLRVALLAVAQRRMNLALHAKLRGAFDRAVQDEMERLQENRVHVYIPDNGRDDLYRSLTVPRVVVDDSKDGAEYKPQAPLPPPYRREPPPSASGGGRVS
jgi:hypothetical protein